MSDFVTGFHTKNGVKKYDYNALANLPASVTDVTNTVISPNADYAEVGEWSDGNPNKEDRLGYFVAIAEVGDNTIKIRKATSADDVRGVSVYNPAFSGNAAKHKYGEDGELLPQYNYIGVMGIVKIIDNGSCTVGGRCMPADNGTAIPSTNNMGYAVLERVDITHVLIAVEPGADMIQRVKEDIENIENRLPSEEGGGLTVGQLEQFNNLVAWYDKEHYVPLSVDFSMTPKTTSYEMGAGILVTFSWEFNKLPVEVTFNGEQQTAAVKGFKEVGVTSREHTTLTYTLYGKHKDGETVTETLSIKFRNNYYYGCAAEPTVIDSDFIKSLSNCGRAESRTKSFTPSCSAGTYVWYAYPKRLGEAQMWLGGFQGGFKNPLVVSVTNSSNFKEDYYVYRSTKSGIGNLSVEAR